MTLAILFALVLANDDSSTAVRLFTTIDGMGVGANRGKQGEIHSYTRTDFTLTKRRDVVSLQFLRNELEVGSGGQTLKRAVMSASGMESVDHGKEPEKLSFAEMPPDRQEAFESLFAAPVCELKVDERGKEVSRVIPKLSPVAEGMARTIIVNSLFFQPPFHKGSDSWKIDRVLSHDQRMELRGELQYTPNASLKGLPADYRAVDVTGTLKGVPIDGGQNAGDLLLELKSAAKGMQIFDEKRRAWVWGEIHFNIEVKGAADNGESFRGLLIFRLNELYGAVKDVPAVVESSDPKGSFTASSSAWLLHGRRADGVYRFRAAQFPGTMWAEFLPIDSEPKFKARIADALKMSARDFEAATAPKETNDKPRPGLTRWIKQGTVRRKDAPDFYLANALVWNSEANVALHLVFETKMPLSQLFSGQRERYLSESIDAMSASFR